MKVELGKRGLLFHHHHGTLPLLHHLELCLLVPHLLLMLQFELVVPLELFFGVTALQVHFYLDVAYMGLNLLLLAFFRLFGLVGLQLRHAFATFL